MPSLHPKHLISAHTAPTEAAMAQEWASIRAWLANEIHWSRIPGNMKAHMIQKLTELSGENRSSLAQAKALGELAESLGDTLLSSTWVLAECRMLRLVYQAA